MKYVVCNLKHKLLKNDYEKYVISLNDIKYDSSKLVVCPTSTFLPLFEPSNYTLGAQNITSFSGETITGEITGEQLKSLGVNYVIVGHSERRLYNREINIDFINKITNALNVGIKVIYCVGETLAQKENDETFDVIEKQISEVLNNVEIKDIIIAYEPVWSIGTGNLPTSDDILEVTDYIKMTVFEKYGIDISVLYGGSVNANNIGELNKIKSVNGFLIGGASLDPNQLKEIIDILKGC